MDKDNFNLKEEDLDKVSGGAVLRSGAGMNVDDVLKYIDSYRSSHPDSQVNFKRLIEAVNYGEWAVVRGIACDVYTTAADCEFGKKLIYLCFGS